MDILEQCRRWNESGAFEKSRELLETIPAEERGPEGDSELATAYLALAETEGAEAGSSYLMKDLSPEDAEEASYVFAEDEEAEAVMELFSKLLEDEGIRFETEEG